MVPEERNYEYGIHDAEYELPDATSPYLQVEMNTGVNYDDSRPPQFMAISEEEVGDIPAGFYIPKKSTVRRF